MKKALLLLIALAACNYLSALEFTAEQMREFPYKLRLKLHESKMVDSDTKIKVIEIRGTERKMKVGADYIIHAEVKSEEPRMISVYAGITNPKNDGAVDLDGYSRYFYPTALEEEFIVGFTYNAKGEFHISAYPQKKDGTDWTQEIFDIRLYE